MSSNQSMLAICVPVELIDAEAILSELGARAFPAFGEVTIGDLARLDMQPHGVYVVHDEQSTVWYVGKATSRSFAERLPAHFDPRPDAWFNTIPKRILGAGLAPTYRDALVLGLSFRIAWIGIETAQDAARVESKLRSQLCPILNPKQLAQKPSRAL